MAFQVGPLDILIPLTTVGLIFTIRHRQVRNICLLMAFVSILTHFAYEIILFPKTGGLDPVYNDEIYFLNYDIRSCHMSEIIHNLFVLSASQAAPFACLVQTLGQWTFYDALIFRMANHSFIVLTIIFFLAQRTRYRENDKSLTLTCYLIALSPTIFFFSTKVLRDTLIMSLVTFSFFSFWKKSWINFFLSTAFIFMLRRHLAVAMLFGYSLSLVRLSPLASTLLAFLAAAGLSLAQVGPFSGFLDNLPQFLFSLPFSISGLHILVADSKLFNASFERILLQRLVALDTFLPLLLVNLFALLPFNRAKMYRKIASFMWPVSVWYHYFYFVSGFTAARQTVLPFLPLFLLASVDLAVQNGWLFKKRRSIDKGSTTMIPAVSHRVRQI